MPELLTGTVTFLFSDIEGSTRLLQSQSEGWSTILARHRELLRAAFEANGGVEVGTEGDSFFVAFPTAPGAVAAAVSGQQALAVEPWPEGAEVRVRIGLHTGEASHGVDGYVGLNVHRASRIAGIANGGQVLLSDVTRVLVDGSLPDGVGLRDLGEHRLKDVERAEHLWQLVIADLPSEFPPIASLDAVPNNLPTRLTTFLGRRREIGEISELLSRSRLLTLTGPGGTGKTRLSLEVAGASLAEHPNGVFFGSWRRSRILTWCRRRSRARSGFPTAEVAARSNGSSITSARNESCSCSTTSSRSSPALHPSTGC